MIVGRTKNNDVYEEVKYDNQKLISVKWIVTEKYVEGRKKLKARLVARGFEESDFDFQSDSPTCSKDSLRITLTIISSLGWVCNSIDIKTAYLQGDKIKRDVWLKPPKEFDNGNVWKLKKNCLWVK